MATLDKNTPRSFEMGPRSHFPVIGSETIFEGAAVGLVDATGYARPLSVADRFVGFAVEKINNEGGSDAEVNVWVIREGYVELTITGVVITDVGQPVYATDDAVFTMQPVATTTSAAFIGIVKRWSESGKAVVYFNAGVLQDPYGRGPREQVTANTTLEITDTATTFFVTADGKLVTLPVTATPLYSTIVNSAAFGTVLVAIDPNTNDKVQGPGLAGTDNKDHLNTKATARRGDLVRLSNAGDTNGAIVLDQIGTWATE